ncbi:PQQ-binding-like beta-propeller repeat protein [Microbulbifer pacificus]|uniref:outer membrane protein assembly factor BamB family protein n=1 Tax=Microbulbifer pacificus TaxID=407164 RepID=UPI000CF3CD65|nr:PQQ-binding-like beta-propeller repeat protein [Microbulbifer pacificus]
MWNLLSTGRKSAAWIGNSGISIALCLGASAESLAGEFTVFDNEVFARNAGIPVHEIREFQFNAPEEQYLLRVHNGVDGAPVENASRILLNGQVVVSVTDLQQSSPLIEKPVTLAINNTLIIEINDFENRGLSIEIVGYDEVPPEISGTVDFPPNENGWYSSSPTITYTCSDDLSGIESCSQPVLVETEGADQEIIGTAVDRAGNTAEYETLISLDRSAPELQSTLVPPANASGWNDSDVLVQFACADALSGISECPEAVSLTSEGDNHVVSVQAVDLAGNSTFVETQVRIDKTPPQIISQLSAAPGTSGWYREPVTVSYQCSDDLSGVASCPEAVTVTGEGEGVEVLATVYDVAGNSAEAREIINLDTTAPEISFISPHSGALLADAQPVMQLLLSDNIQVDGESLVITANGENTAECTIAGNIATCGFPQPLPIDTEVVISASINDSAGNSAQVSLVTGIDTDKDEVADYLDHCPQTTTSQSVDENGCALNQLDSDDDGISDAEEIASGSNPEDETSFPPVLIEAFSASPTVMDHKEQQVELRWQVKGASTVSIGNDLQEEVETNLASEGTLAVNPKITTRYTLVATGPGGESSQELTITLDLPPPPPMWTAPDIPVQEKIATSLAVAEDGSAYVGAFDGNFYKVNSSGQVEWKLENAGVVMGKAVIAGDKIIVGSNFSNGSHPEGLGRAFSLRSDKTVVWNFDTQGAVVAGPVLNIDKTTAYIATYYGHIYALNAQTGELYWDYQLPNNQKVVSSPALVQQKLIVHTEQNNIYALDVSLSTNENRIIWEKLLE